MPHYRTRILSSLREFTASDWDRLVAGQSHPTPFLRHAFLHALHEHGCASQSTGWEPRYLTLWQEDQLAGAIPLYLKHHSYGEYVFDWAWADAYARHELDYYPKLLSAIPFTPVTGARLIANSEAARHALLQSLVTLQEQSGVSSTHVLFPSKDEASALEQAGFLLRRNVQFHWQNQGYDNFDHFLGTLDRKKRKNILAERRKVTEAGVSFEHVSGKDASEAQWAFFYQCYANTYTEHRSSPYLSLGFFMQIGQDMPENLLLTIAYKDGKPIAASLVVHDAHTLYGRYWGAIEHVPCLHFETAYYQPITFCIAHKIRYFEGGAQGEHKMARGFLPEQTWSAHWLQHPSFYEAVERFLARENQGMAMYMDELNEHQPFRHTPE